MTMNIGSTAEEQKRIDTLIEFMGEHINSEIVWELKQRGFFIAPASINHHGQYEGALFDHSYEVAKALVNMTEKLGLKWENERSPYIVGMFHDLCKMDNYKATPKGEYPYEYNNDTLLKGHGVKSVMLLSQFYSLTTEEIACVTYHMGAFTPKEEWRDFTGAVNKYPNVLWTHTADMIASHVEGV